MSSVALGDPIRATEVARILDDAYGFQLARGFSWRPADPWNLLEENAFSPIVRRER
jgi:hypothetical protein